MDWLRLDRNLLRNNCGTMPSLVFFDKNTVRAQSASYSNFGAMEDGADSQTNSPCRFNSSLHRTYISSKHKCRFSVTRHPIQRLSTMLRPTMHWGTLFLSSVQNDLARASYLRSIRLDPASRHSLQPRQYLPLRRGLRCCNRQLHAVHLSLGTAGRFCTTTWVSIFRVGAA
jgi:hypothetical protein